jgi:hypothetical protein
MTTCRASPEASQEAIEDAFVASFWASLILRAVAIPAIVWPLERCVAKWVRFCSPFAWFVVMLGVLSVAMG